MKQKIVNLYEFSELSPDAQQHAIDKLRDINVDFPDWHDGVLDYWKTEILPPLGFDNAEIYYRGFWSQGDGASFAADVDIVKFIKAQKAGKRFAAILAHVRNGGYYDCKIKADGYYSHEYTMSCNFWLEHASDKADALTDELGSYILEVARENARAIYSELENEYTALTSDEAIKDTIEANEYTFDEDGNLEN